MIVIPLFLVGSCDSPSTLCSPPNTYIEANITEYPAICKAAFKTLKPNTSISVLETTISGNPFSPGYVNPNYVDTCLSQCAQGVPQGCSYGQSCFETGCTNMLYYGLKSLADCGCHQPISKTQICCHQTLAPTTASIAPSVPPPTPIPGPIDVGSCAHEYELDFDRNFELTVNGVTQPASIALWIEDHMKGVYSPYSIPGVFLSRHLTYPDDPTKQNSDFEVVKNQTAWRRQTPNGDYYIYLVVHSENGILTAQWVLADRISYRFHGGWMQADVDTQPWADAGFVIPTEQLCPSFETGKAIVFVNNSVSMLTIGENMEVQAVITSSPTSSTPTGNPTTTAPSRAPFSSQPSRAPSFSPTKAPAFSPTAGGNSMLVSTNFVFLGVSIVIILVIVRFFI